MAPYNPSTLKKPSWLKVKAPQSENYFQIKDMLKSLNLATVCQEARCPNMEECWGGGTATFMLMGDTCTRGCRFCSVKTGNPKGVLDSEEPYKVGYAISKMALDYVVLTSVNRDDLPDQGSHHFAQTVRVIKEQRPDMLVEVLCPDFQGMREWVDVLVKARPDVLAHNVETVKRLTAKVRDRRANYEQSLKVLEMAKMIDPEIFTKTSIMLGLSETDEEIRQTLVDLRAVDCDVVTFGQYLQPTPRHLPIVEYITPEKFQYWQEEAGKMGFLYVASGPLVRSSYRAGEFFLRGIIEQKRGRRNSQSQLGEEENE